MTAAPPLHDPSEAGTALPAAAAVAVDCAKTAAACESKTTIAAYLDRLVRRAEDVDVMPECRPQERPAVAELDDNAAFEAFMAALMGEPLLADLDAAPAQEQEAAPAAAIRPMLDFVPFRWLTEPAPRQEPEQAKAVAAADATAADATPAAETSSQIPASTDTREPEARDAERGEPVSFFP